MDELLSCSTPLHASATRLPDSGSLFAVLTFDDGFRSFVESALPELVSRGIPAALFVPAGNLGRPPEWLAGSAHADANETVLDAEELRRLPARLVTVGSHTLTHPRLSGLAASDAWRELAESRGKLQCVLGRPVSLLSLPHGDFDASVLELARAANYSRVFTVSPGLADLGEGVFVAGRCPVAPGEWRIEFRLKVRGAYSWLGTASAVKRRLLRVFLRRAA
jgi:peptidoglycan/xylan/chitin deacetylase (PgdA/CDA1 family)